LEIADKMEPLLQQLVHWQRRQAGYLAEHPRPWPFRLNFDMATMTLDPVVIQNDFKFWRVYAGRGTMRRWSV
jgi:hypothetical protein